MLKMTGVCNDRNTYRGAEAGKARIAILVAILVVLMTAVLYFRDFFFTGSTVERRISSPAVTVGISNSLKSLPLVLAERIDAFTRQGLDVKLVMEPSAGPALDRMMEGQVDIACAPEMLVALLALERNDFRILAVLNRNQSQVLIINTTSGAYSPFGLKGRRIGLKMDSAAPYFLYRKLLYHELSLASVELVDVEPPQMADKLVGGEIDAAVVWPPYTDRILKRLGKSGLVFDVHIGRDIYWLMIAREDWCREQAGTIKPFLSALQDGFDFMASHPEKSMATAADYFGYPPESVRREWDLYHFGLELPQSLLFAMEQEVEWWRERHDFAGPSPDFLSLIAYRPLETLYPDKVTIIH